MILGAYGVKDRKAGEFLFLVTMKVEAQAVRFFKDLLKQGQFEKHPEDYSIWILGDWNTETGLLNPCIARDVTPYSETEVISNG